MNLKQKKRDSKITITDMAILKVPYIRYEGLSEEQNKIMQQLTRDVLTISKVENECNEVAITCDIADVEPLNTYGVAFGNEYSVDVLVDTVSNHLITSRHGRAVVLLHNHPSTKSFSLEDIDFFIRYYTVKIMVVVSNQGKVHFLHRKEGALNKEVNELFESCVENLDFSSSTEEYFRVAKKFLKNCGKAGIYYK